LFKKYDKNYNCENSLTLVLLNLKLEKVPKSGLGVTFVMLDKNDSFLCLFVWVRSSQPQGFELLFFGYITKGRQRNGIVLRIPSNQLCAASVKYRSQLCFVS
jgi:hypothetical protein